MRKNTWYAVYHQRELDFLARSYQPGYFFIFMGRKPLTEYLPIDGSKPMKGNLDLDIYKLLFANTLIREAAGDVIIRNRLDTVYAPIRTSAFRVAGSITAYKTAGTTAYFQTALYNNQDWVFRSYDTALRDVMQLINGMANIPRAGDITGLAGKILSFPNIQVPPDGVMDLVAATSRADCHAGILVLPDSRPAVPAAGDCRYDAPTDTFEIYDGAAWHAH